MAEDKKTFIAYTEWGETFNELSNENAGKLIKHLFNYVNDLNPNSEDDLIKMCFIPIKQNLKRDLVKWNGIKTTRSDSGRLGGLAKQANARNAKKNLANLAVNDTVNVTVINSMFNFNAFWNLYDKKRNAKKTQVKWKTIKESDRELIMHHVPRYVNSTPDKQLRKDPLTYLNQEAWNDEIIKSNNQKTGDLIL